MIQAESISYSIIDIPSRRPKGIGLSPYGFFASIRYLLNYYTNGYFSYQNCGIRDQDLLHRQGEPLTGERVKVLFLGDIMTSKSGNPPQIGQRLKRKLQEAQIIVANVESPVIASSEKQVREGLSFRMNNVYLKFLEECSPGAKLVFNIANNHACDGSRSDRPAMSHIAKMDLSVIERTVSALKEAFPSCQIIGAEVAGAHPVSSFRLGDKGPRIGFVGWTDVMNHDADHYKKPILRGSDITEERMRRVREDHDILIGFPHGNVEQSYYPLTSTRNAWVSLLKSGVFDGIVGHGPHTLMPAEMVAGTRPLFHSIGNFCSPEGKSQTKVGCVAELSISVDGLRAIPNVIEQSGETVDLVEDLNDPASMAYPEITFERMNRIWKSLKGWR